MESAVDSASTASSISGVSSSGGSPRVACKPSSPARAHSPPTLMAPRLPPLPPPGLGLLGSLQMMHHASPLELMAAAHHHAPRSYGSPPPISTSDPAANECKLVDYRGQKVAAFIIQGDTMLCLPQAFELFLKHLVGGLHTVYTKLKRLDIVPLVCNVEQVRILRGLGAIQPGVNRCKLLCCKDFDVLYRDCTTARCLSMKAPDRYDDPFAYRGTERLSAILVGRGVAWRLLRSRPGRPPKRASVGLSLAATHLSGHPFKKHRMENGEYSPYENGHLSEMARMEKSPLLANGYNAPPTHLGHMGFMHGPHAALLSPSLGPHVQRPDGSIIKGQPGIPNMEALARSGIWENCRAAYEDIVKHLERLRDERGDVDRALALEHKIREGSQNGSSPGLSPVLNLSKSGIGAGNIGGMGGMGSREADESSVGARSSRGASPARSSPPRPATAPPHTDDEDDESVDPRNSDADDREEKEDHDEMSDIEREGPRERSAGPGVSPPPPAYSAPLPSAPHDAASTVSSASSTETLLRNIQGLLKVAADNARQQERQITYEKAELKMDVLREREVKDNLERQLLDEQKMRVIYQKRLKKERKVRQRVQEQLENEIKRKMKIEEALKQSGAPVEVMRLLTESMAVSENCGRASSEGAMEGAGSGVASNPLGSGSSPPPLPPAFTPREVTAPPPAPVVPAPPPHPPHPPADKPWNYSGLDIVNSGAAFWQNYSESLAQEIEMERKSRQQAMERDVKSPLSERAGYYKNSVLFSSAT